MGVAEFDEADLELRLSQRVRAEALARAVDPSGAPVDPTELARAVARAHGITVVRMLGRERCRGVARARLAYYAALREAGFSYPEIGKIVDRDHTTIIAGVRSFYGRAEERLP